MNWEKEYQEIKNHILNEINYKHIKIIDMDLYKYSKEEKYFKELNKEDLLIKLEEIDKLREGNKTDEGKYDEEIIQLIIELKEK